MTDIVSKIAREVANTVWTGVQDVFSSAGGALVAIIIAILLSIFPVWVLCIAAGALFVGILYTQYQETLDTEPEE